MAILVIFGACIYIDEFSDTLTGVAARAQLQAPITAAAVKILILLRLLIIQLSPNYTQVPRITSTPKLLSTETRAGAGTACPPSAEETSEGALSMLKGGAIDDIDILIGMHGRPIQECRVGQAAPALYYSAATHIRYDIIGKQSHGARPYLGVSALDAACLVVAAANALRFDSNVVYNLKATQIHADAGVPNAVPGNATVTFDLRSQSNDVMDLMIKKLTNAAKNAAASIGAEAVENILHSTPASIITPEVTNIIAEVIKEELGSQALIPPITTAGGEDFFWYPKEKPELKTGFIALGEDAQPGLHDPNMHFDHSALPNGVKLHVGLVKKILG